VELKDNSKIFQQYELERNLAKLLIKIQAAHRSSIEVKRSYDLYTLAFKDLARGNELEAFMQYDHAAFELTDAINNAKYVIYGFRIHSSRTLSFFFKLYGLYAILYGVLASLIFASLIYYYPSFSILDVPIWACLFAGLGASAQILSGVVGELRHDGLVTRYKRLWYTALPLLGMVFGYMAYLLFSSGLIAFNAGSQGSTSSTMLVCFLAGFATNWLICRLSGF
jgi:hypothetical protein